MMSSFIRDTRGVAMVEGVIVLPIFVIVFAAVLYYHRAYTAKLESNSAARTCAWTYAVGGCVTMPVGCSIAKIGEENFSGIDDAIGQDGSVVSASSSSSASQERSDLGAALGSANSILVGLVGLREGIVARPSRRVKMPSVLGGGSRRISGNYSVMCNERPHTFEELVKEAYCAIGQNRLPGCPDA